MAGITHAPETTELAAAALGEHAGAARAALFERVLGRVHRYFFRVIGDPDQAEECAQETLLLLERSLHEARYEAGRSFNTWIFLKAHQVYVAWCRRRERDARRHGTADWSRDEWLTYLRRHAPVPVEWYDWAGWQVGLDVEEAPDDFDLEAELAALGLAAPPPPPG